MQFFYGMALVIYVWIRCSEISPGSDQSFKHHIQRHKQLSVVSLLCKNSATAFDYFDKTQMMCHCSPASKISTVQWYVCGLAGVPEWLISLTASLFKTSLILWNMLARVPYWARLQTSAVLHTVHQCNYTRTGLHSHKSVAHDFSTALIRHRRILKQVVGHMLIYSLTD